MSKIADVGMPETPTPLALANVGNGDTPPPLKQADVLNGWFLCMCVKRFRIAKKERKNKKRFVFVV